MRARLDRAASPPGGTVTSEYRGERATRTWTINRLNRDAFEDRDRVLKNVTVALEGDALRLDHYDGFQLICRKAAVVAQSNPEYRRQQISKWLVEDIRPVKPFGFLDRECGSERPSMRGLTPDKVFTFGTYEREREARAGGRRPEEFARCIERIVPR